MLLGFAAGFWSFRDGMSGPVKIVFAIGLIVIIVLAVGLFFVRNFGRRTMTRLRMPHRVTDFTLKFDEKAPPPAAQARPTRPVPAPEPPDEV